MGVVTEVRCSHTEGMWLLRISVVTQKGWSQDRCGHTEGVSWSHGRGVVT